MKISKNEARLIDGSIGVRVQLHRNGQRYQVTRYFETSAAAIAWLRGQERKVCFVSFDGYVDPCDDATWIVTSAAGQAGEFRTKREALELVRRIKQSGAIPAALRIEKRDAW